MPRASLQIMVRAGGLAGTNAAVSAVIHHPTPLDCFLNPDERPSDSLTPQRCQCYPLMMFMAFYTLIN